MNEAEQEAWRLYRRLDVVVNARWPYAIRIAATRAIQKQIHRDSPLRLLSPDSLLVQLTRGQISLRQLTQQWFQD